MPVPVPPDVPWATRYEAEPRPLSLSLSRAGDHFTFLIASESGEKHFVAGGTLREEA